MKKPLKKLRKAQDGTEVKPVNTLEALKEKQKQGTKFYKTNVFGKTKEISPEKYIKKDAKYSSKNPGGRTESSINLHKKEIKYNTTRPRQNSTRSVSMATPVQKRGGSVKSKKK